VPSGIWAESEYTILPAYDGTTAEQAMAGAVRMFFCHSAPSRLCAGWAGCHDMRESFAVRLAHRRVNMPALLAYVSPVPLFGSGREAAEHGLRDLEHPGPAARRAVARLMVKIARRPAFCPGCGRVESHREWSEQGMCNECQEGGWQI
jgi:hypothetical protein